MKKNKHGACQSLFWLCRTAKKPWRTKDLDEMIEFCVVNCGGRQSDFLKDKIVEELDERGQYSGAAHWVKKFGMPLN